MNVNSEELVHSCLFTFVIHLSHEMVDPTMPYPNQWVGPATSLSGQIIILTNIGNAIYQDNLYISLLDNIRINCTCGFSQDNIVKYC